MGKEKFLAQLRKELSGLPQDDVEERLTFYSEMIEDQIEEGLSEEDAISAVGSVDEIVAQVTADIPFAKHAKKGMLKAWKIVLLLLGFPIWFSLGVAAISVILSLYVSLWAVFGVLTGCSFGSIVAGIIVACNGNILTGFAMLGAGIFCAGLSIFMFYGCKAATKGVLILTNKFTFLIKNCFIKEAKA